MNVRKWQEAVDGDEKELNKMKKDEHKQMMVCGGGDNDNKKSYHY